MAACALSDKYRLMESFTLPEASQLIMMHQPGLVVIDGRGLTSSQIPRLHAAIGSGRNCRFVVIVRRGAADSFPLPPDLASMTTFAELTADNSDPTAALEQVLNEADVDSAPSDEASIATPDQSDVIGGEQIQQAAGHAEAEDNNDQLLQTDPVEDTATDIQHSDEPASTVSMADGFRTRTPELRQMLRRLQIAATHNVTLLLIGETGSGKTHLARLIHESSTRAAQPFIHVACGALPEELLLSELFGHVKGSFTSAHADKEGKFVAAGRGTILLDEIDVLSLEQQVKLLRVIETGLFEPVGSNQTLKVNARIIAASNLQLQPLVSQGQFRPDLYYRLNTLCFAIPPLRKRLPDIEPLARFFVHHHAEQHGIDVVEITEEFMNCLLSYPWPGNVREMENAIRSAVIYSEKGVMTANTLPMHIVSGNAGPGNDPSTAAFFGVRDGDSLGERIELTEKDIIEQALLNNNFSRTNTARHLGISRVTLYNKMRKYGIMPEK